MKRTVKSFSVKIENDGTRKYVHLKMTTDRQKPHEYQIATDTRHPQLDDIETYLNNGLNEALKTGKKIDIRDFEERMYVFIETPISIHSTQFTANKIS